MKELLKKKILNKDEIEKLDLYFDSNIEEFLTCENDDIVNFIELSKKELGYSLVDLSLGFFLSDFTIGIDVLFDENELELYLKRIELINRLNYTDYGLGFTLGDYYLKKDEKERAMHYYKNIFKNGYDLNRNSYFYSLERYLSLVDDSIQTLMDLITYSPSKEVESLDFSNVYLLLIAKLDKEDSRYIEYIEKAIKKITPMVRDYQERYHCLDSISDSDEERNLCELLSLKFEYFVEKKQYKEAYQTYKELTEEIGLSGCLRYYHFRDKKYWDMVSYMKEDYPELCFFDNVKGERYDIVDDVANLEILSGKEVVLTNKDGRDFRFIIKSIYKEKVVTMVPVLPLLGEGAKMITTIMKDSKFYFQND